MSWSASAVGEKEKVVEEVRRQLLSFGAGDLYPAVANIVQEIAALFPAGVTVSFDTNGHVDPDGSYGNATFALQIRKLAT